MAFWSNWLKRGPECGRCGERIQGDPVEADDMLMHSHCHLDLLESERRRREQDQALSKLETRGRIPQRAPTPGLSGRRDTPSGGGGYRGDE